MIPIVTPTLAQRMVLDLAGGRIEVTTAPLDDPRMCELVIRTGILGTDLPTEGTLTIRLGRSQLAQILSADLVPYDRTESSMGLLHGDAPDGIEWDLGLTDLIEGRGDDA